MSEIRSSHEHGDRPVQNEGGEAGGGCEGPGEQAVVLKAVYYADEPEYSPDDAILDEIVTRGGKKMYRSKCDCCNRREITAVFGDRAAALSAAEALDEWDAEVVEITPFRRALGDHAVQDDLQETASSAAT